MPGISQRIVVLGSAGPMVKEWENLSVTVDVLDIMRFGLFQFRRSLIDALPDEPFDHVIVWTNSRIGMVANALNKYKANLYFHVGNPVALTARQELQARISAWIFPVSNKLFLRPVSKFVQQGLSKSGFYKRYPSKVSLKPIEVSDARVKSPTGIAGSAPLLGMVARLDKIKDHDTVIRSLEIIRKTFPGATLHLAGDGSLKAPLQELASALGLGDHVIFHGDVKNVPGLMQDWDLFLYGTTEREGLGGTVPEALAIGLPVVATDLPMVREWDPEGNFIVYCRAHDPNDMAGKVVGLLRNLSHRRKVFEQGAAFIKGLYSPARFAANYIDHQPVVA